jgi:hypothetical protein
MGTVPHVTRVAGEGGDGVEEFIARNPLQVEEDLDAEEADAALGALLLRYLRQGFDRRTGSWLVPGRDEHETLRRTCHAAEVLHRIDLDKDTATMVREAGNWLINLPVREHPSAAERFSMHVYPSRFKTLAYLGRFDDLEVRRDFINLLRKEVSGLVRNVGESDILTTCIALDTLLQLQRSGRRQDVCSDEQYGAIVRALRLQLRAWRPASGKHAARRGVNRCEIDNPRDLSYVLGLLLHADRENVPLRVVTGVVDALVSAVRGGRSGTRGADMVHALYAALQLAEHYRGDELVRPALVGLLAQLRSLYTAGEAVRRWDLMSHTLVLRLLLTYYGDAAFARAVASRFLRDAERRHDAERDLLETELQAIVRERLQVQLGAIKELSGGFTDDRVYRVPFSYIFPTPGGDQERRDRLDRPGTTSMIVKRSTRDAFQVATENYNQLPTHLRDLFVRMPSEAQVYKSGQSSSYFLVMEDLTNLYTFRHLFNEFDQRAMPDQHRRLLAQATTLASDAVFSLFRGGRSGRSGFPGTQLSRLYLSQIEGKLTRAVERVPWLKNPLESYRVGEQRYKGLDYYLGIVIKHAHTLQPRWLGLTHGDFHARNIMLDRDCTLLKLIDLDKLSRTGDYVADMATLLQDVCVYRRVTEPERDFGLARTEIEFAANPAAEAGTVESAVRYPALGRSATVYLQELVLDALARFSDEIEDAGWKPRFWLATATALLMRLAFQTEKEPAAVIYGEGIRLLHELSRHLEHGQPLPALLFPLAWPEPQAARTGGAADLPEWAARSALLRGIDEGIGALGVRAEYDRGAVRYYSERGGEGPVAAMTAAHKGALARLLLCCEELRGPCPAGVESLPSGKTGERLRTVLALSDGAEAAGVVALVRASLEGVLPGRVGAATRRRE